MTRSGTRGDRRRRTRRLSASAPALGLAALIGVAYGLILLGPQEGETPASVTMWLGFLLVAAYLAGRIARYLDLPRITGYLVLGWAVGPYALGILSTGTVSALRLVDELALSLIALSAGGELRLPSLRRRLRSILTIAGVQLGVVFGFVAILVYESRRLMDFLSAAPRRAALAVALLFGLAAVAKSPATTVAVITEERARGVLTDTVLGVTVLKDVLILVLMALLIPLAAAIADPARPFDIGTLRDVSLGIVASLAVGVGFGGVIGPLLRRVPSPHQVLLVLGAAFLSVEMADLLGLEYILISMAAGFVVQNYSHQGSELIDALESNSLPIYALFFAVAGAGLDVPALRQVWPIALVIVVARFVSLYGSTYLAARLAHDGDAVRRHAWTGFVAMAGVTLGIANLIRERFPVLGGQVAAIIIAVIAVNQLIGPPIFRRALVRTGEAGR